MGQRIATQMSPIFLVAARRSGTTLFRLMLDGHPNICWFRGWEPVAVSLEVLARAGSAPEEVPVEGLGRIAAESVSELREKIDFAIGELLTEHRKQVFGATVHVGFPSLLRAWPNARFVHLVRDPRDIAISNLKLGWSGHPFEAANTWADAERDWDQIRPYLAEDQYIDITYEALVTNPRHELTRVCEFIGVPFHKDLFSYTETSNYGYPKPELSQRWRGRLSKREIQLIEYGLREHMVSRGYEPEADPKKLFQFQKFFFRQFGIWKLRQKKMKEYGLRHLLMRKAASILNSDLLDQRIHAKEKQKRQDHIKKLERDY